MPPQQVLAEEASAPPPPTNARRDVDLDSVESVETPPPTRKRGRSVRAAVVSSSACHCKRALYLVGCSFLGCARAWGCSCVCRATHGGELSPQARHHARRPASAPAPAMSDSRGKANCAASSIYHDCSQTPTFFHKLAPFER